MSTLIAPDEPFDQSGATLVSVDGITLVPATLMAPENFTDYAQPTKTSGWVS